jgi:hypothetical protein
MEIVHMKRICQNAILGLALGAISVPTAIAETIKLSFSGTITGTSGAAASYIAGSILSGYVLYDSQTPHNNYEHIVNQFQNTEYFTFGDTNFAEYPGTIFVDQLNQGFDINHWKHTQEHWLSISVLEIGTAADNTGSDIVSLTMSAMNWDRNPFLPNVSVLPISIDDKSLNDGSLMGSIAFYDGTSVPLGRLDFVYTVFSITPVPLPTAAWLFLSGILGFIGFSLRRKNDAGSQSTFARAAA